jgi:tetratricopeptide (TPR) repeat protein
VATLQKRQSTKAAKKNRPRKKWLLVGVLLGTILTVGGLWFLRHQGETSSAVEEAALISPPAVDVSGIDPAVARAVESARAAVNESPRSVQAWGQLGKILLVHDFHLPAITCLAQAERLDPANARWPYLQGMAFLLADPPDPDAAIQQFERAVTLGGDTPEAMRLRLGETLFGRDRLDEAEQQFQRVLQLHPANARAHLGLARLAVRRGDLEKGRAHLEHTLADPHAKKASRQLFVEVEQRLGKEPSAEELREATRLPEDAVWPDPFLDEAALLRTGMKARIGQAERLIRQGRALEAVSLLQPIVQDYPDSYYAWLTFGRALIKQRSLPAAERALATALKLEPNSAETRFYLGVALSLQGKQDAGEAQFRSAVQAKPDFTHAHYNLGASLFRRGDRAGAIEEFRAALRCEPDYADAHTALCKVLIQSGRRAEALVHARLALQYNPADATAKRLVQQLFKAMPIPMGP